MNTKTNFYNYTTLQIPLTSPNGNCINNKGMINFLEDQKKTCGTSMKNDYNSCINFNHKRIFQKNSMTLVAGISGTEKQIKYLREKIKFRKVNSRFYSYDYEWFNLSSLSKFENLPLQTTKSECICTNIITKVEYNFYVDKTEIKDYEVVYFMEDVLDNCGENLNLDLSSEVNFRNYNKVYFIILFY